MDDFSFFLTIPFIIKKKKPFISKCVHTVNKSNGTVENEIQLRKLYVKQYSKH